MVICHAAGVKNTINTIFSLLDFYLVYFTIVKRVTPANESQVQEVLHFSAQS